ncbi:MAG: GNAT family N-acetyltransferase [Yoonia sp.]|nr:GNAT family N-acetyltransferase [Yoonia sp.]
MRSPFSLWTRVIIIRPSTIQDTTAISEMAHACYSSVLISHYAPDTLKVALPHMAHVPVGLAQCGTYFVAVQDDIIVGACGWTDGPRGAEVRKLAVHPDHLRKGIARSLLTHVHGSASTAGHERIGSAASLNAVPFYCALGYKQTGWVKIDTGHEDAPFDAATMERPL